MAHFSKFIGPGAIGIETNINSKDLIGTALLNPNGSIVVALLNQNENPISVRLNMGDYVKKISVSAQAVQTITISKQDAQSTIK